MGRKPKPPKQAYNFYMTLETEMEKQYKFFPLRLRFNPIWARLTFKDNLDGALMFCLVRKKASIE
jgi:hypothetical protein